MAMDLASDDLMVLVCSRIDITYSKANKSVLRIRDVFFRTQTPDPTIFHPGSGSWIQTLTFTHPGCDYLREFSKKFEMILMLVSGARGKVIKKATDPRSGSATLPVKRHSNSANRIPCYSSP
jgi:hypothetical protein